MFQTIHDVALMLDRERVGREASPTGGVVDSQSVKAPEAKTRGYDAGKKIVGRKRHIAVDTDGRLLMVNLTPADISDSAGAQMILDGVRKRWPWLKHLFADGAYDRTQLMDKAAFRDFTKSRVSHPERRPSARFPGDKDGSAKGISSPFGDARGCTSPQNSGIIKRSDAAVGFEVIPRRWVVERTFAWMTRWRRLVRDYEERIDCSEAMIHVALGSVLLRRRTNQETAPSRPIGDRQTRPRPCAQSLGGVAGRGKGSCRLLEREAEKLMLALDRRALGATDSAPRRP